VLELKFRGERKKEDLMTFDNKEIMDKLKLELDVVEKGGYAPSVHDHSSVPQIFRDSVSCPNLGLEVKVEPCSDCYLMAFVPPEHHDKETPCHHIPLNERGDTVASLSRSGDNELVQSTLLLWLQKTISRLVEESKAPNSRKDDLENLLRSLGDRRRPCLPLPVGGQTSSSYSAGRRG
jgi:hypothetical protein